jgi:RimJ/RimL family protein N-acetyltransferase
MIDSHEISLEEHVRWFTRANQDPSCRWLLYSVGGTPAGVGYITDISSDRRTARWGFYKAPESPAGTGSQLCCETLAFAFSELPLDKIFGDVLLTNEVSISIHRKLGFVIVDGSDDRMHASEADSRLIRFEIERCVWERRNKASS